MTTETTVRVTCDHCKKVHYEGLSKGKPQHIHVTFWSGISPGWDPEDLCRPCAEKFGSVLREFGNAFADDGGDTDE